MADEPKLIDELKKMEYEPLLPVEKKLIAGSLLLGIVLLGLLMWISHVSFPGRLMRRALICCLAGQSIGVFMIGYQVVASSKWRTTIPRSSESTLIW